MEIGLKWSRWLISKDKLELAFISMCWVTLQPLQLITKVSTGNSQISVGFINDFFFSHKISMLFCPMAKHDTDSDSDSITLNALNNIQVNNVLNILALALVFTQYVYINMVIALPE